MIMAEFIKRSPLLEELLLVKPKPSTREEPSFHEHQPRSQTFTKAFTTFLVFISVFMEHFFCFKGLQDVPLYLVLHWLTSVSYVAVFYLLARNLPSFITNEDPKGSFSSRVTLTLFYIMSMYIKETDLAAQVTSQGPSAFLVNLCLSPLIVTASLTCLRHSQPASWVSAVTVTYSGMMLMTVCSDEGSCYVSIKDAGFNFAFTAFYGIFLIKISQYLQEVSVVRTLLLLNTFSVALMPGLMVFSVEGTLLWSNPSILLEFLNPTTIIPLILLKLFQMITAVLHIKVTSVTTHVMTRNLAWIPTCITIGMVCHIELMVSSFKAFWIVLACYLLHVIPDDHERPRLK